VFPNNQIPFSQQPGKAVTDAQKYQTQSGQIVEIRWTESTILEGNMLRKEKSFEVFPPLNDNRIPDSVADIRECRICLGLFHKESVLVCPVCGGCFCLKCRDEIKSEDDQPIAACKLCAQQANTSVLGRLWRKFWHVED
jgi:hypothetical protein